MENYDSPKRILVTGGGVFSVHTSVKITVNNKELTLWPYPHDPTGTQIISQRIYNSGH